MIGNLQYCTVQEINHSIYIQSELCASEHECVYAQTAFNISNIQKTSPQNS